MTHTAPVIWWVRRDLRLADNPALTGACSTRRPVIPVYVFDEADEQLGAAPRFRLGLGLGHLDKKLRGLGSRLILRRGPALETLSALLRDTGATHVFAAKAYHPDELARDKAVLAEAGDLGVDMSWSKSRVLFDPWDVQTGTGGMYRVYSPFWRAVRGMEVADLQSSPSRIPRPQKWPESEVLADWGLDCAMHKAAENLASHCTVGEAAAQERLDWFVEKRVAAYKADRNEPWKDATSGLSENLAWGEISPVRIWHAGQKAMAEGRPGAEHFLKELVWREFAYHLMYHTPHILTRNWREDWDKFPWTEEVDEKVLAWQQGRTGVDIVDAGMRELWVTGRMHNRVRMIVASYLCKHLMKHWKIGLKWFEDTLIDWDPASNAMGWQWVAGSGPDAAPFFRIFNPDRQREQYDAQNRYLTTWLAEGQTNPPDLALSFFENAPESWRMRPRDIRPNPIVDLAAGRAAALQAYEIMKKK
ncbi:MAG: deoxyribodipyrimidine photo-lyase [Rhodobacteraceae bacterium]|nr:deoxyribodipyrimidine photo-lyase [Paracoccaceae bacterium]